MQSNLEKRKPQIQEEWSRSAAEQARARAERSSLSPLGWKVWTSLPLARQPDMDDLSSVGLKHASLGVICT